MSMSMSGVSDLKEGVENEEESFPQPMIKKQKVDDDLVGGKEEQHNTHSFSGLSDQEISALSDRQIFEYWRKCYRIIYEDPTEYEPRFRIFQKALRPPIPEKDRGIYYAGLADRTEEELGGSKAYLFDSDIKMLHEIDEINTHSEQFDEYWAQLEKNLPPLELKDSIRMEKDGNNLIYYYE